MQSNMNYALSHCLQLCLIQQGLHIALAESCTGGGVAREITHMPNCSKCFEGGIVAYSNAAKIQLLGVQAATLDEYGAVSTQCAQEMAVGALKLFNTDICLSVTGIAGPLGGTEEKPVGTICFALAQGDQVSSKKRFFSGGRKYINQQSIEFSLQWLLHVVKPLPE